MTNHHPVARALAIVAALAADAAAAPVPVANPSFEADAPSSNEFFFGDPAGWTLIDDAAVIGNGIGTDVRGTLDLALNPNYFGGVAPHGDDVAILFIGDDVGQGEVGLAQVTTAVLAAHTRYTLTVAVGNIESGPALNGSFFSLRGFPGYRIELRAGGVVLESLSEGIDAAIDEGEFVTRSLAYVTGASDAQLGQPLEIRLINLNLTDPAYPGEDLEVDFDAVTLDATPVAAVSVPAAPPAALTALALLLVRCAPGTRASRGG